MSDVSAETLTYSDYRIWGYTKSRIDRARQVEFEEGFRCPTTHCNSMHPVVEHGEKGECEKCGLRYQRHGNALECELDKPYEPEVRDE